jgi:HPt (histidine-containing phosphotransfer) domain-containing protein
MALNYNLAKVYALSDNDPEFVNSILELFVTEVPEDLALIKSGIKEKDYKQAYAYAHKIKPSLDLLGMNVAYEEILQVEAWTRAEGKRSEINATFESIENQIVNAVKEIKKDFDM